MASATRQIEKHSSGAKGGLRSGLKRVLSLSPLLLVLLTATAGQAQEPTRQPAANAIFLVDPTPPPDSVAELQISWTPGDGAGTVVLMKQGLPVDADPVDGTEHVANPAFGSGEQLGTENYVVFLGVGTQVTVTNLQADVPYFLALYSYNGSGGGIDYLVTAPARKSSGHNASHVIDCVDCHFDPASGPFHGGWVVPRDAPQATVCKGCHNATGEASGKAAVDVHKGTNYNTLVDCGSCHDVHNNALNQISTDTHTGGVTAPNVEWIRADTTKYVAGAQEDALFQANTGFFAYADGNQPWNGLCQTCHLNTDRHTNDFDVPATPHSHEVAAACTTCHTHEGDGLVDEDGFTPQGGDCIGCHSKGQGPRRQITESSPGAGDGEFSTAFRSHHVNDGTGTQIATPWDCVVCHAEGDVLTGSPNDTYHKKDGVQLKDVDTGAVYTDWSGLTPQQRSDFCLSCHDSDGATIITARTDPDPDATTVALNPFNDGVTNAHEADGFGSVCTDGRTWCDRDRDCSGSDTCGPLTAPHPRGRCSTSSWIACGLSANCPTGETCELLKVVDVAAQFDTLNASHHAVFEPAYIPATDCVASGDPHPCCTGAGTGPDCLPFGSGVDGVIQGARTDLTWNSTLNCEDCHYGSPTTKLSAHGTDEARYMLRDKDGNDTYPTPSSSGNLNVNCFRCHVPSGDPDTYPDTVSAYSDHIQGAHIDDTLNLFGISCLNCHGGGTFGAIHGVDQLVIDDDGGGNYNPNVFTWGSSLDLISNWGPGPNRSVTCSARANSTLLNDCTQHGSKGWTSGEGRTYRAP
jgi:hypothetical protein